VIGSSAEEVRAWLVRVGVDEVRPIFLAVMPVSIPILIATVIACIDVVIPACLAESSAVEVSAIVHDLHTFTASTTEEVIGATSIGKDFFLALSATVLTEYLLELWED
jgi:hypothetical protein